MCYNILSLSDKSLPSNFNSLLLYLGTFWRQVLLRWSRGLPKNRVCTNQKNGNPVSQFGALLDGKKPSSKLYYRKYYAINGHN